MMDIMDNKKIYKILQEWFPVLAKRKIPKKEHRQVFTHFLAWMLGDKEKQQQAIYLMTIHRDDDTHNGLELCALLQRYGEEVHQTQQRIRQRKAPILAHFEQHKAMIGRYYHVQDQVFDIVFDEMMQLLATKEMELLLIYAQHYHWIAVPKDANKIEKFCHCFNQQFKAEQISIEQYSIFDCARST